jgi:riboflavin biosynthesis pyrimidine reductase
LVIPPNSQGQIDLPALLAQLHQRGIERLMVEGGASIITNFLAAQLADRIVVTIAPVLVGGLNAVGSLVQPAETGFPRLRNPRYEQMGDDLVLSGDVMWAEEKVEIREQRVKIG